MGDRKQYDRTELLDRAVELFRLRGFNGTSTAELVAELGVNRKSMYAEFGSKLGLFEAALQWYDEKQLTAVLAPIEAPDAGLDAIRATFAGYASASTGWARGRGCLMCNTAVERGALDASIGQYVAAYLERIASGFHNALDNARRSGDIDPATDIGELAAFLTTALMGVAASIRAEAPPQQIQATCTVVAGLLDAHRPATGS